MTGKQESADEISTEITRKLLLRGAEELPDKKISKFHNSLRSEK